MTYNDAKNWIQANGHPGLASIIVPVFNRPIFVIDALESAKYQDYRPLEIIVVDDGSTDDTGERVKDWIARNEKAPTLTLKYLQKTNGGAPSARNLGIVESTGEFIQLLDSDDFLASDKLKTQISYMMQHPTVDFASSAIRFAPAPPDFRDWTGSAAVVRVGPMRSPYDSPRSASLLVRRSLYVKSGPWNEDLAQWQDWEYAFRLFSCRPRFVEFEGPHSGVRIHAGKRIGDLVGTQEGVKARTRALASMAQINKKHGSPSGNKALRRLYTKTLEEAILCNESADAKQCLDDWRLGDPSFFSYIIRLIFAILIRLPGRKYIISFGRRIRQAKLRGSGNS